jgi:hypothetical protein
VSETCVIDVGDSYLPDALLARGLDCLAALDISDEALARLKARGGAGDHRHGRAARPTTCSALPVVRYLRRVGYKRATA